jgi:hypothetical protein
MRNGSWDSSQCLTSPDNVSVACKCGELSFYSVVSDVKGLFTDVKVEDPFTADSLENILNFEWQYVAITYIIGAITLFFFVSVLLGLSLDKRDAQ